MTQSYFLLGRNVSRSPSPDMMNSAFRAAGIDAEYKALSVEPVDFDARFLELKRTSSGMNITIPFKSEVIPMLDELDPISEKIGAVNVTKSSGGRWLGFNTDVTGIVSPLRERFGGSGISRALLLGAGGAARAFCEAMSEVGCKRVTVAIRSLEKGAVFVEQVSQTFPDLQFDLRRIGSLGKEERRDNGGDFELIFNATPMGSGDVPLADGMKRVLYGTEVVFDAVYRPRETELLKLAREKGCRVIHGYEMLLGQGTAGFEKWTGVKAPVEIMKSSLLRSLEEA